ncbi:hypothetical protein II898_08660 [bacterium]|nr:hypothetical protein [bacterium]
MTKDLSHSFKMAIDVSASLNMTEIFYPPQIFLLLTSTAENVSAAP